MTADWQAVRAPITTDRSLVTADELEPWARLIGDRLGLDYPPERRRLLRRALTARLRATGCASLGDYAGLLTAVPWEWDRLIDVLTVRETEFFRQPDVFEALRATLLPALLRERAESGRLVLRIWSAGCSEGDEVYSLAMLVHADLPEPWLWDVRISGTDLSAGAIEAARLGRYRAERLRRTPAALRQRYVEPAPDGTPADQLIGTELRALVRFRQLNLVGPYWPMASQDLIVCQNVLYYLRPAARALVLERLYRSLAPHGYLIVGPAEAPTEPLFGTVRPVVVDGVRAYRRA
jgi:chemotaxis protein methyltransferase CheR